MLRERASPSLAALSDGSVLVVGGTRARDDGTAEPVVDPSAEIWDPRADRWRGADDAVAADGSLRGLVALDFDPVRATWLELVRLPVRDPSRQRVSRQREVRVEARREGGDRLLLCSARAKPREVALRVPRFGFALTPIGDGLVLVTGGWEKQTDFSWEDVRSSVGQVELVELRRGVARSAGELELARHDHAAALLPDGRIVIAGGRHGEARETKRAELGERA
jgi:hypothetical protein